MAKKIENEIGEGVVEDTEVTETTPAVEKVVPVRVVIMEDGSQVNFGSRATLLSNTDVATGTIVFKLFTGKIISYVVEGIEAFSEFQKQVYLFGLQSKIRSALSNVKDVEEEVLKQIAALKEGKFSVRSGDASDVSLDNHLKAWATVMTGKYPNVVATPHTNWTDLTDVTVINEVLSTWNALSPKEKIAARKNVYVVHERSLLDMAELAAG